MLVLGRHGAAHLRQAFRSFILAHPRRRKGFFVVASVALSLVVIDRIYPLPLPQIDAGMVIIAQDGTPLRTWPDGEGVWRYAVDPDKVSKIYLEALLGYEDRAFWWHPGVNPFSLLRAAGQWAQHGQVVSGGSTITMQVARILEPQPRSLAGKLRQIARALQLEWHLSKREILTIYLNHAPMGGIVEGVEMASRSYLGKSSKDLSHAEAALLAALPQAPSRLRPDRWPERAQAARNKVIERMAQQGRWRPGEIEDARSEKVVVMALRSQWLAPIAAERVRQEVLTGRFGPVPRDASGRTPVHTTIDRGVQTTVERMLLDRVNALPPKVSMAVMVLENESLEIRAYAGSADFGDDSRAAHVDMVRAIRSPGSTLKPFLYALALDEGLIHSESLLIDAPQSFGGYQPGNFQMNFSGPVSAAEALQRSLNVPAVDLLDRLGPDHFASVLRAGGIRLRMPQGERPNLSLILGGAGTNLEELVGAYRALAAGGMAGQPRFSSGAPKVEARVMSEGAAFIVRDALESRGDGERSLTDGARRIAWKTGTSFGFRDAWAIGVGDRYTVGVWVGRPDGSPNPGVFGANVAAPLVRDIFAALMPGVSDEIQRKPPSTVTSRTLCWPLGLASEKTAREHCHVLRRAWVLNDTVPPTLSDRKRNTGLEEVIWVDPATSLRVPPGCLPEAIQRTVARWPLDLEPWMAQPSLRVFQPPEDSPRCRSGRRPAAEWVVVGLHEGATLMPAAARLLPPARLHVIGNPGKSWWLLDGRQVAVSVGRQPIDLQLNENGWHRLTVLDENGRFSSVRFAVKGLAEGSRRDCLNFCVGGGDAASPPRRASPATKDRRGG